MQDLNGVVRRTIVHCDDLNVITTLQGQDAINAIAQIPSIIVAGNDETDKRGTQNDWLWMALNDSRPG